MGTGTQWQQQNVILSILATRNIDSETTIGWGVVAKLPPNAGKIE